MSSRLIMVSFLIFRYLTEDRFTSISGSITRLLAERLE